MRNRMLQNDEIKQICDVHHLSRHEVYNIRSQFTSMCQMSRTFEEEERMKEQGAKKNYFPATGQYTKPSQRSHQTADGIKKAMTLGSKGKDDGQNQEGININYFINYTNFLSGSLPEINLRILDSCDNMDVNDPNAIVKWETFLDLYCIFVSGAIDHHQLIKFWMKFFNKQMQDVIEKETYMTLLEQLVRGKSMDAPTEATMHFADNFRRMMDQAGCLDAQGNIVRDKLQQAFEEETVDIQSLCSALGNQQLDK